MASVIMAPLLLDCLIRLNSAVCYGILHIAITASRLLIIFQPQHTKQVEGGRPGHLIEQYYPCG
jgi:hypothetical protein